MLDYISSGFNGKTAKILELQNSMKISKMFQDEEKHSAMLEKQYNELDKNKLGDFSKQLEFMIDKLQASKKVEEMSQMESYKQKYNH